MNLDEFIVPSSIGTPAGISPAASNLPDESLTSNASTVSAVPIKQHHKTQPEELQTSRASAPTASAMGQVRSSDEFSYVPRHVRKTSIDESRVRSRVPWLLHGVPANCYRNGSLSRLLKYHRSPTVTAVWRHRVWQTTLRFTTTRSTYPATAHHSPHKLSTNLSHTRSTPSTSKMTPSSTQPAPSSTSSLSRPLAHQ